LVTDTEITVGPQSRWPLNHYVSTPCAAVVQLNGSKFDAAGDLTRGTLRKVQ
jgi:hypothetical protein